MIRNADEKERARIDRELDAAAIRAQLLQAGGTEPRRRNRQRPTRPTTPAPNSRVVETGRYRKVAPPGFTPEEISRDAEAVKAFVANTQAGRG